MDNDKNVLPIELYFHYPAHSMCLGNVMRSFSIGEFNYICGWPFFCPDDNYIKFYYPEFYPQRRDEMSSDFVEGLTNTVKNEDLFFLCDTFEDDRYRTNYKKEEIFVHII